VKYVHDGTMKVSFFFCEATKTTTKAKGAFQFVKDLFAKHELDIQSSGCVCAEGAPVMLLGWFAVRKFAVTKWRLVTVWKTGRGTVGSSMMSPPMGGFFFWHSGHAHAELMTNFFFQSCGKVAVTSVLLCWMRESLSFCW